MNNLDILKGKNDRKNNMDILTSHHLLHLNYVFKYFKIIFYLHLQYLEFESWVLIRLNLIKLRVIITVLVLNSSAAVAPYFYFKSWRLYIYLSILRLFSIFAKFIVLNLKPLEYAARFILLMIYPICMYIFIYFGN